MQSLENYCYVCEGSKRDVDGVWMWGVLRLVLHVYRYFCDVLGTNVDFVFPVQTEDDDDDDDVVDIGASKSTEEHMPEIAGSVSDFDAPADDDKSCFDFYG